MTRILGHLGSDIGSLLFFGLVIGLSFLV